MYELAIPTFAHYLDNLAGILKKAAGYADEKRLDIDALLDTRLFPDMFTLCQQVRGVSYHALVASANLCGRVPPEFDGARRSLGELFAEIAATQAKLKLYSPKDFDGAEERMITLNLRRGGVTLKGERYLTHFALPNFFFHVTTAYDILRQQGVPLGKVDFLGRFMD